MQCHVNLERRFLRPSPCCLRRTGKTIQREALPLIKADNRSVKARMCILTVVSFNLLSTSTLFLKVMKSCVSVSHTEISTQLRVINFRFPSADIRRLKALQKETSHSKPPPQHTPHALTLNCP